MTRAPIDLIQPASVQNVRAPGDAGQFVSRSGLATPGQLPITIRRDGIEEAMGACQRCSDRPRVWRLLVAVFESADPDALGLAPRRSGRPLRIRRYGREEIHIHAADIASGCGLAYEPPGAPCDRVLRRLFR